MADAKKYLDLEGLKTLVDNVNTEIEESTEAIENSAIEGLFATN